MVDPASWRVLGACVAGTSHVAKGRGGDDAWACAVVPGAVIVAAADGAGSARLGALGAGAAVDAGVAAAHRLHRAGIGVDRADRWAAIVVGAARRRIRRLAADDGTALADLSTTVSVVAVTDRGTLAAQVGDGAVVVCAAAGIVAGLRPGRGEFANETTFVTSSGWRAALTSASFPAGEVTAVALTSDGMRLLALADLATGDPFVPFYEDAFAFARDESATGSAITRFLESVEDRTGDDKTLVVAVDTAGRRTERAAGAPPAAAGG